MGSRQSSQAEACARAWVGIVIYAMLVQGTGLSSKIHRSMILHVTPHHSGTDG